MLPASLPLFPAVRHVRLSGEHLRALFGDDAPAAVHTLVCGHDVSDRAITVECGDVRIDDVRVLLPAVPRTYVALTARDARRARLVGALGVRVDDAPGCTLHGPHGVVVLAAGVVSAERVVLPPAAQAGRRSVDLTVLGDRPRTVRALPVVAGEVAAAFVGDDGGEFVPGVRARPT